MISKKKNIAIILGDEAFNYIIDTVVFYKTNSGLNTFIKQVLSLQIFQMIILKIELIQNLILHMNYYLL